MSLLWALFTPLSIAAQANLEDQSTVDRLSTETFSRHTDEKSNTFKEPLLFEISAPNADQPDTTIETLRARFYSLRRAGSMNDFFYTNQGDIHWQQGDIHRSITSYLIALTLNPQNLDLYFKLSDLYVSLGNYQLALDLLNRAGEIHGEILTIELRKVEIYLQANAIDAAWQSLGNLLSSNPQDQIVHMYIGDAHLLTNRLDLALQSYEYAIQLSGLSAELAARLGELWMIRQDYLMAIVYFRYWLEQVPHMPEAFHALGLALSYRGRHEEAQHALREAATLYLDRGDIEAFEATKNAQQRLELTTLR